MARIGPKDALKGRTEKHSRCRGVSKIEKTENYANASGNSKSTTCLKPVVGTTFFAGTGVEHKDWFWGPIVPQSVCSHFEATD